MVTRWHGVHVSYLRLQNHKAKGTWPTTLAGVKPPALQTTDQYRSHAPEAGRLTTAVTAAFNTFRTTALDAMIAVKGNEEAYLLGLTIPSYYGPLLINIVREHHAMLKRDFGYIDDGNEITRYSSEQLDKEYQLTKQTVTLWGSRIVEITRARHTADQRRTDAKRAVKAAADVEMADPESSRRAMDDRLLRMVEDKLRRVGLDDKVRTCPITDSYYQTHFSCTPEEVGVSTKIVFSQEEGWLVHQEADRQVRGPCGSLEGAQGSSSRQFEGFEETRQREREAAEITELALYESSDNAVRYDNPLSYPDEILRLSTPLQLRLLLSIAPPSLVEAVRFRSAVHLGPNVHIPSSLSVHISAGLRYMLYNKYNPMLLKNAFEDFERRLRWKIFFLNDQDHVEHPYDPDYEVYEPSTNQVRNRIGYIEDGLAAGREYIAQHVQNSEPLHHKLKDSPDNFMADLKEFLDRNNYVITPTDKNLGAAVVERDWLIRGGHILLSDPNSYREVDYSVVKRDSDALASCIQSILALALDTDSTRVHEVHPQLAKFLASKLPKQREDGSWENPILPDFYVIPKIHKKPMGYRPIVPCHSVMQEPLAKLVSKSLKPVLATFPTIIQGSKDLAQKL
jgi:hypothetical protein